jgi:epoxide hydrolase-like predicted phosphatase
MKVNMDNKMIKAVIFDYGGVVKASDCHFTDDIAKVYGVSKEKLIKVFTEPLCQLNRGDISEENFWEKLSSGLKKKGPNDPRESFRHVYKKFFQIFPEIINLVKELKEKGIKTGVLSNAIKIHADVIREYKGYEPFDVVILSYEVGMIKPEKEIYQLTLDKLGVKAEEAVFIDDKENNLVPAKELGMKIILAKNSKQIIREVYLLI